MRFILASASPDRKRLLQDIMGIACEVIPSHCDEDALQGETPRAYAGLLAEAKARMVFDQELDRSGGELVVLGADTLIAHGGVSLGKPEHREHAREILGGLLGTSHELVTGYCLMRSFHGEIETVSKVVVTTVTMRNLADEEFERYLDSGGWKNKAGAYGIQEEAQDFITSIEGCFFNVVGLPLCDLSNVLQRWGVQADRRRVRFFCQQQPLTQRCLLQ
jgi:septum formation protein